jgi:hypothetical protein
MNADADDVALPHSCRIQRVQRLVDQMGITPPRPRRGRQHIQPARREEGDAEGHVAGVNEVNPRAYRHSVEYGGVLRHHWDAVTLRGLTRSLRRDDG